MPKCDQLYFLRNITDEFHWDDWIKRFKQRSVQIEQDALSYRPCSCVIEHNSVIQLKPEVNIMMQQVTSNTIYK